jgi:hypothetical protein
VWGPTPVSWFPGVRPHHFFISSAIA